MVLLTDCDSLVDWYCCICARKKGAHVLQGSKCCALGGQRDINGVTGNLPGTQTVLSFPFHPPFPLLRFLFPCPARFDTPFLSSSTHVSPVMEPADAVK
jgi:hypothetical protein